MHDVPKTRHSLILRLKSHDDAEAWEEFCEIYEPLILRIGTSCGLQAADAADLVQDVFIRVAKSVQQWEPDSQKGSFRGWIGSIARNLTIDLLRQRKRRPAVSNASGLQNLEQPLSEEALFDREYEIQRFVWAAGKIRHSFAAATWQAFWLTAVQAKSVDDVADQLGLSKGAIYIARSRVIARLRKTIERESNEQPEVGSKLKVTE